MTDMNRKTREGVRCFTCKLCGLRNAEPVNSWRKKPQKDKNVCQLCIGKRAAAVRDARERAYLYGHRVY